MADGDDPLAKLEARLKRLEDEAGIRHAISKYGRAIDRADAVTLSSIFDPEAEVDYGEDVFVGSGLDFVPAVLAVQSSMVRTHHMLGQSVMTFGNACVNVETYHQAVHIIERDEDRVEFATGGRYLDRLAEIEGGWRVVHRKVVVDWMRELKADEGLFSRLRGPPIGARGANDPSEGHLATLNSD